ncbi:hypothetical protein FG167_07225 [Lacinutrix sp. WUR7]|uniref:putative capsular polysaccharide synthesis family protein n=1 Tax=Lacinutrix sp. WUR7 TaxID=2653681 RepID=UPI00193E2C11|nr:putative capsular polysaccharide synthesis family protein [Lacinutrix sp. WUR7]QRM89035.1 hypothetical protein FG167_07225 [Lacinutrix sp. WUR7]
MQLRFSKTKKPIIIHTMGKVGSLSVYTSLKRSLATTPIFHTHNLNVKEVKKDVLFCFENGVYPGSRSPVFLIDKYILKKQRPFKVITLFRDPIERNISAFFDAFQIYVGVSPEGYQGDLKTLEKLFFQQLPHAYPLQWYEDYMLKDLDFDVYTQDFDAEAGFQIIKQEQNEMLLMHCDLADAEKEKLIKTFCAVSNFQLTNTNVRAASASSDLYIAFKNYMQFPEEYIQDMYTSKYAMHFFSEKQRNVAIEKWTKKE